MHDESDKFAVEHHEFETDSDRTCMFIRCTFFFGHLIPKLTGLGQWELPIREGICLGSQFVSALLFFFFFFFFSSFFPFSPKFQIIERHSSFSLRVTLFLIIQFSPFQFPFTEVAGFMKGSALLNFFRPN